MLKGEYLYAQEGDNFFIKLSGELKYTECSNFASFISELEKKQKFNEILVDLSDALYIDSTNLGLLAKIAQLELNSAGHRLTVISTNKDVTELLRNIGFDDICLLVDEPNQTKMPFEKIMGLDKNEESMAKVMLEAHRRLMNMNEQNKKEFHNVVELMEKQINSQN